MNVRRTMAAVLGSALLFAAAPSSASPVPPAQPGDRAEPNAAPAAAAASTKRQGQSAAPSTGADKVARLATPSASDKSVAPDHEPHTVLVKFKAGTSASARGQVAGRVRGKVSTEAPTAGYVKITTSGPAAEAVKALRADATVEEVTLDYRRTKSKVPNDYYYAQYQKYLSTIRLPQAWDLQSSATGVTIAIVDTGVDAGHPDLAGKVVGGYNSVSNNNVVTDYDGHGTMVAGIAAASTNNSFGVAGAAYNGRIMPIMVFSGQYAYDSDIAEGVTWAVDHGAKVVNMSLGGSGTNPLLHDAVKYAVGKGVVVVVAAGNTGGNGPHYPAMFPEVLTVGATDHAANLTDFSSWGEHVDLAAPGYDIISTHSRTTDLGSGFTYAIGAGTSFSSPLVAGVAALVRAKYPSLTPAQVMEKLKSTARDAGPRGIDPYYGAGVLDAYRALGGAVTADFPLRAAGANEPNNTPGRAIAVSTSITGSFAIEGDADWYRYQVTSAKSYTFKAQPPVWDDNRAVNTDPVLALYDANLRLIQEVDSTDGADAAELITRQLGSGTYYLKVRNFNGSPDTRAYTLSVSATGAALPFADPVTYDFGQSPTETVAIGDVTGDGRADVVSGTGRYFDEEHDYRVVVWAQQPDGSLAAPVKYSRAQIGSANVVLTDFNKDGRLDVALVGGDGIEVLKQNTAGTLDAAVLLPGTSYGTKLAAGDVDGDGDVDFAVNKNPGAEVQVQQADGTFTATRLSDTGNYSGAIKIADVNGDGRDEVVSSGLFAVRVSRLTEGAWQTAEHTTGVGQDLVGLEIADINSDGRADIMTASYLDGGMGVLRQKADGTFASQKVATPGYGGGIRTADWNKDGRTDVIMGATPGYLSVFPQQADGTLGSPLNVPGWVPYHADPLATAVGDINGDGRVDVVQGTDDNGIAVYLHADTAVAGTGPQEWVRDTSVPAYAKLGRAPKLTVTLQRALDPATVTGQTVRLLNGRTGLPVDLPVSYDAATRTITVTLLREAHRPVMGRVGGTAPILPDDLGYRLVLDGVTDTAGNVLNGYSVFYLG